MSSKRLTVFASGSGSNFKVLHQAALNGEIPASITALVSDKPDCGAVTYARSHGITIYLLTSMEMTASASRLKEILKHEAPDLIILAGYLRKIPDHIVDIYPDRIINIHPSLLPKYGGKGWYGHHVHRAVIENNENESGCTVHYVNKVFDEGPIIAQERVTVNDDDTPESLAKKIQKKEHSLYPKVVRMLLSE